MILAKQDRSIHTVLEEAITTNPIQFTGEYLDKIIERETPGNVFGTLTIADTVIIPEPDANTRRVIGELNFYNADTVSHNIHVILHVSAGAGADYIVQKAALNAKQTLHYNLYTGWYIL